MTDWTLPKERGFSQGIAHSSARLGNALTPPLVVWLVTWITWRGSFFVLGILSLGWAAMWAHYFCDDPRQHPCITPEELEALPDYTRREVEKKNPVPWLRLARRMFPVTAVYFCYGWTLWLYLHGCLHFFLHNYGLALKDSAFFSAGVFLRVY